MTGNINGLTKQKEGLLAEIKMLNGGGDDPSPEQDDADPDNPGGNSDYSQHD